MSFVRKALFVFVLAFAAVPGSVGAQTLSITQEITITARVAPSRSIIVNDQGKMVTIYSNTDENVEPKVYLNSVPGEQRELTPELRAQYDAVIAEQDKLVGVEIPVEPPKADEQSVTKLLFGKVSTLVSTMRS